MLIDQLSFYDVSIMSMVLLVILFVTARLKRDHFSFTAHLVKYILILTGIGVVIEPLTWLIDQKEGTFFYVMGYLLNSLLLIIGTILVGVWASYWDYKMIGSKKRVIKNFYYLYPAIIQVILLIYNVFVPSFFEINAVTNVYIRKPLYIIPYLINYGLLAYIIIFMISQFKHISKRTLLGFVLFMTLPILNSVIQLLVPGLLITWPSLTLSVIVVYLFLETTTGNIDDLTKLFTRRLLELHLTSLIEDKKPFCAMMIDLDQFKDVNDFYGHVVGDKVLTRFAEVLNECKPSQDTFIARLGGDEFFMIHQNHEINVDQLIEKISFTMKNDMFLSQFAFLGYSLGTIKFEQTMTMDDVLNLSDRKMYEQKKIHKQK